MQLPGHSTYRMKTGRWLETFCSVRAWPKPSVNRQAQFSSSALCALCLSLCISVLPRHLSSFCICISISPGHRRPMALWNNVWKNIGMYVGCGKQVFRPTVRGEHTTPCWKKKELRPRLTGKTFLHSIKSENLISCTQFRTECPVKRQKAVRIWPNLRREEKASQPRRNQEFSINSIEFSGAIFWLH